MEAGPPNVASPASMADGKGPCAFTSNRTKTTAPLWNVGGHKLPFITVMEHPHVIGSGDTEMSENLKPEGTSRTLVTGSWGDRAPPHITKQVLSTCAHILWSGRLALLKVLWKEEKLGYECEERRSFPKQSLQPLLAEPRVCAHH